MSHNKIKSEYKSTHTVMYYGFITIVFANSGTTWIGKPEQPGDPKLCKQSYRGITHVVIIDA